MQDPLQYPFIGIVKLETGEELIAQVHYSEDDNVICLQNPMIVIEANSSDKSTMIKGFKLDLWIKSAMDPDEIFLVNPDRILTCTEANPAISKFYEESIPYVFRAATPNKTLPTKEMGSRGSVDKARMLFEKLYKS